MQQMPKVSVLVPVYNVEKTLKRCVDSILDQTFKDFEIILIDDGSTDNSGALCDELSLIHKCISVIHKPNEGLGPTRNRGVEAAKGTYVYHCDSDDWLSPNLLEKSVNAMEHSESDFLIFGYTIYTEDRDGRIKEYDRISVPACIIQSQEAIRRFFCEQYYNSFSVQSACNRLYRRDFLFKNNLIFPPLRRCQDMAFSLLLFSKASKIICFKESFYNYIIEPGVFKGRAFDEMIATYLEIYRRTSTTFSSWGLYDQAAANKLENKICEHIANYTAFAIVRKYPKQWKKNITNLLSNDIVVELFSQYNKSSKFMRAFAWGVKYKSKYFLLALSKFILTRQQNA